MKRVVLVGAASPQARPGAVAVLRWGDGNCWPINLDEER